MIATTCEPTFWPTRALPNPVTTWLVAKLVGPLLPHDWSKIAPVRQSTPWYCTVTVSLAFTVVPVPTLLSAIFRVPGAFVAGIFTLGVPLLASVTFGKPDGSAW